MALSPGTRLGSYEITGSIGAGGMGEVYHATDTRLGRKVAIKVLPADVTSDPDRLRRFRHEAQAISALNHPNIVTLHEVGSSEAGPYLVLEIVEGKSLRQLLDEGGQPVKRVLSIAAQIANGLSRAHSAGIMHRDLKPGNVMVTGDGLVKILDFGLAKLASPPLAVDSEGPTAAVSPPTASHVVLGTPGYVSPEQAAGRSADFRADQFSFGALLYEMATGERPFRRATPAESMAAVISVEPEPLSSKRPDLPPQLGWIVERCLAKDPNDRYASTLDLARNLEDLRDHLADVSRMPPLAAAAPVLRRSPREIAAWSLAGIGLIASIALTMERRPRETVAPTPHKLLALIGADGTLPTTFGASVILSPDGTTLAFFARQAGQMRLFVRRLDHLEAAPLAGTEGAENPFFSPDGQWIAFFAGGKLKKVSVMGGAPVTLCDAVFGQGGAWTDDDTIIFTPAAGNSRLMRVPASGGTPAAFGVFSTGAITQRWPQSLPGGKAVLYTEHSSTQGWDGADLVVASLSGGTPKVVLRGGYYGRYARSGHLVFMRRGTLFAVRFDADRLETIGPAVPALEGIAVSGFSGSAQFALSSEGTLAYVPDAAAASNPISWMTRDGRTSMLRATRAQWAQPRFSPDGRKLALNIFDGKQLDIWVYDWGQDALTQLTFDPGDDSGPVWTPDGRRIVFSSDRAKPGIHNLYEVNADGTGEVARLTESPSDQYAYSFHPSGRLLAFSSFQSATTWELMILPVEGDARPGLFPGRPTVFLSAQAIVSRPMFSPDGRWIAYQSNEAGTPDVYVRPFAGPGGPWRISNGGGSLPVWSKAAHELLFLNQGKVMFASYSVVGDSFRVDAPKIWSPTGYQPHAGAYPYDLHPDGKRLAIIAAPDESSGSGAQDKVVFFFGFGDYLKKIAPVKP